ncbi:unnamed protein product [Paramecium sonneborni]|uniref:Uncharacterized protein n=1 Tax=Paramecium sonneborni TaxID=65129 RepID=A0A8S1QIT2_9CILI|nr:unnamed protein product [Paramecium sonneborni]
MIHFTNYQRILSANKQFISRNVIFILVFQKRNEKRYLAPNFIRSAIFFGILNNHFQKFKYQLISFVSLKCKHCISIIF